MTTEDILEKLRTKYRENGYRLSNNDAKLVYNKLLELLREEKMGKTSKAIEFIIDFPPEIGISAYINYYKSIDPNNRRLLNKMFVSNQKFMENRNNKGIDRGAVLIKGLISEDGALNDIFFILQKICELLLTDTVGDISEGDLTDILSIFNVDERYKSLKDTLDKERKIRYDLKREIERYQEKVERLEKTIDELKEEVGDEGELKEKKKEKKKTMRLWKF